MNIFINNEKQETLDSITVSDLIKQLGLSETAVIEINGEILTKNKHQITILKNNDQLDIFEITGGG